MKNLPRLGGSDNVQFGCVNTLNGVYNEGYISGKEMKFKKRSFLEKIIDLFRSEPTETEFLRTFKVGVSWIWSDNYSYEAASLYRDFNKITLKTVRIYSTVRGSVIEFDINAYEVEGELVRL